MDNQEFINTMNKYEACEEAIVWVGSKSLEEAYPICHRGDWLMWLVMFFNMDTKENTILIYCDFIRKVLEYSTQPTEALLASIDGILTSAVNAEHRDLIRLTIEAYEIYKVALAGVPENNQAAMFNDTADLVRQRVPVPSYSESSIYNI